MIHKIVYLLHIYKRYSYFTTSVPYDDEFSWSMYINWGWLIPDSLNNSLIFKVAGFTLQYGFNRRFRSTSKNINMTRGNETSHSYMLAYIKSILDSVGSSDYGSPKAQMYSMNGSMLMLRYVYLINLCNHGIVILIIVTNVLITG